eukprot:154304-Chlamydomonas_euryale.AAC.2
MSTALSWAADGRTSAACARFDTSCGSGSPGCERRICEETKLAGCGARLGFSNPTCASAFWLLTLPPEPAHHDPTPGLLNPNKTMPHPASGPCTPPPAPHTPRLCSVQVDSVLETRRGSASRPHTPRPTSRPHILCPTPPAPRLCSVQVDSACGDEEGPAGRRVRSGKPHKPHKGPGSLLHVGHSTWRNSAAKLHWQYAAAKALLANSLKWHHPGLGQGIDVHRQAPGMGSMLRQALQADVRITVVSSWRFLRRHQTLKPCHPLGDPGRYRRTSGSRWGAAWDCPPPSRASNAI